MNWKRKYLRCINMRSSPSIFTDDRRRNLSKNTIKRRFRRVMCIFGSYDGSDGGEENLYACRVTGSESVGRGGPGMPLMCSHGWCVLVCRWAGNASGLGAINMHLRLISSTLVQPTWCLEYLLHEEISVALMRWSGWLKVNFLFID